MRATSDPPARDLSGLLHARSVCLVGASGDSGRTAGQPLQILDKHGFPGPIVCVNPKYTSIVGRPCYPSIAALPDATDVALITLPAAHVPEAIRECGLKGIKNVVVLSAGFEETVAGRELGAAIGRYAAQYEMTVLGPNSEGLWSTPAKLLLTHGTAAQRETIVAGGVTVLTQSGSIGAALVRSLQDAGVGCRYLVSLGNETNLTLTDCLEWMVSEGKSRVILLFVEGLRDGARFVAAARRAASAGIAVVALKAGASAAGREATASHTGKIASFSHVYSAMFRQAGILEVQTLVELLEAGEVFSLPALEADESSVGIVSASGGCRALLADAAERRGIRIAAFAPDTVRELVAISQGDGVMTNPVDVPMQTLYNVERFSALARAVAADPNTTSLLVQYANRGVRQVNDHLDLFGDISASSRKPLVVSFLGDTPPSEARTILRERGVLCAREPDQAIRYLSWLRHRTISRALAPRSGVISIDRASPPPIASWEEQLALLARCGIGVPPWRTVAPGADPQTATRGLKFPVAVKAFPQDADHKAEAGLVQIGVRDGDALLRALATVREKLPGAASVLVQEMVTSGVEVLLAARVDPDFGAVLAIGTGGAGVEWLADVTYLSLPADKHEIQRAIDELKLAQLLAPFRGRAAADRDGLVTAACRLGDVFLASPNLREVEINPLFVRAGDDGVVAVDVLTK